MDQQADLKEINTKIQAMKEVAEDLKQMAGDFPALYRNTVRILASINMLELNVTDVLDLGTES
jgi:hypothetical protein